MGREVSEGVSVRGDEGLAHASFPVVLGVTVHDLGFEEAVAALRATLRGSAPRTLFFVNAHTLEGAAACTEDRRILNAADFVFGDGTGVRWAARLQGVRLRANLNGTDLVPAFMAAADGDGLRCFLVGATSAVVAQAASTLAERYPGWRIVGHHHGFIAEPDATEHVLAAIAAARPDLVLVGMGNPLQERWIAAHRARIPATLCAGVGGLFSYLTGDYRRAPPGFRRFGLEWLFVVFTQRQKWRRYVVGAPMFLMRVGAEKLGWRR